MVHCSTNTQFLTNGIKIISMIFACARFQLEKSLTEKSAEAEGQAREIAESKKELEKLNKENKKLKVRVKVHSLKSTLTFFLLVKGGRAGCRGRRNRQR